ncbi:hypothetical protein BaRGS_00015079 [Batillaria attramentaria]|uniref:N-acetyltransferase domain-containing protein n=1 Tax=Batillaria attramentaria TaxID=370345 RepID=A0ABD0L2H2_9CAEN
MSIAIGRFSRALRIAASTQNRRQIFSTSTTLSKATAHGQTPTQAPAPPKDAELAVAQLSDYQAVMDIDQNLFSGTDRLTYHYPSYLIGPGVKGYVLKKENKVVGFVSIWRVDGGETISATAARITPGVRYGGMFARFFQALARVYVNLPEKAISFTIRESGVEAVGHKVLNKYKQIYGKEFRTWDVDVGALSKTSEIQQIASCELRQLSRDDVITMLNRGPDRLRHLFPNERVLGVPHMTPCRVVPANVNVILESNNVLLASGETSTPHHIDSLYPGTLLTDGSYYYCNRGVCYSLEIFGTGTTEELRSHLAWHLNRLASFAGDYGGALSVYYPDSMADQIVTLVERFPVTPCAKDLKAQGQAPPHVPTPPDDEELAVAQLSDYQAVLDIDHDVFRGTDRLRYHYPSYIHGPGLKGFIYKKEEKVVGFVSIWLVDGGETISGTAARTAPEFRFGGMFGRFSRSVLQQYSHLPDIRFVSFLVRESNLEASGQKVLKTYRKVYEKEAKVWDVDVDDLRTTPAITRPAACRLRQLSRDDVITMLSRGPNRLRHLFPEGRLLGIPHHNPCRVMPDNVDVILESNNILLVSGETSSPNDINSLYPGTLLTNGSFYYCKRGVCYSLEIFGTGTTEELRTHLAWHLKRLASVAKDFGGVLLVYYPDSMSDQIDALAEKFPFTGCFKDLLGPTIADLRSLSQEMRLRCTEEELNGMSELMDEMTSSLQRVSEIPDPSVPVVKYPRTPGHKPTPEDNPYNGWAWRCEILGAKDGKLVGKTLGIKDTVAVAGVPMRCGGEVLDRYVPEFDATVVARILDAGGRIMGKTATDDLCCSGSGVLSCDGPVTNPVDQTRVAGGSSSGSAALVAGGVVDMALGGDQGGSIRIPASLTGIVGLKPTFGLVPYTGAVVIETTLDHLGPMARTVTDCALLLEVIAGYDGGRDPRQCPGMQVLEYSKLEVKVAVRQAAYTLQEEGMTVKEVSVPMHKDGGGTLAKGFHSLSLQEALFQGYTTHPHDLSPVVKSLAMFGEFVARLYGDTFSAKGHNLLMALTEAYDAALEEVDVLILPTVPFTAPELPPAAVSTQDLLRHALSFSKNTRNFNMTGHPALTVNAAPSYLNDKNQLPVGMMIVGKKFDDVTVLQVARAFEKVKGRRSDDGLFTDKVNIPTSESSPFHSHGQ